jgi:glycosyltransferase involved in cell wall biosynthesis
MTKEYRPHCVIRAPVATRSGYGEMSRDIVRHLIEWNKFDIEIHSINWGDTPMDALNADDPRDKIILDHIKPEKITTQPDLYISISVPTEFWPVGKYNIGITAGIETSIASPVWIQGCNQMDLILTISKHAKDVFEYSKWSERKFGQERPLVVEKPIEILHNCINTKIFKKLGGDYECVQSIRDLFDDIPEKYNYLFVGHWMKGELGEDRKNVGFLIKLFYEVFKQKQFTEKPGLILKTSGGTYSILDQESILEKINSIKQSVQLKEEETFPNVYIIHGDLTEQEMNSLYNHSKVKTHITFTKGEGFGRPLLEACMSGKPIIASGWSGHLDFLNPEEAILIGGELKPVHPSAVWENVIIKESTWFHPDIHHAANAMVAVIEHYDKFKKLAGQLTKKNKEAFAYNKIRSEFWSILEKHLPKFEPPPVVKELKLPELKKVEPLSQEIKQLEIEN